MSDQDVDKDLELAVDPSVEELKPVEIAIEGDKAEVVAAKTADPAIIPAEEGIADLKRQLAEERAKRAEAERIARENDEKASQATKTAGDTQYDLLTKTLASAKSEVESAQDAVVAAQESGDYRKAAQLTRDMVRLENRLQYLENTKANADARREAGEQPGRVIQDHVSELDHIVSQLTPKSAEWVKAHPDVIPKWNKVLAAHSAAVELEGLALESPEYFAYVEKKLSIGNSDAGPAPAPVARDTPVPAAPASRDAPSISSGATGRTIVTLTPEEREMAAIEGMTDVEYAKQKAALIKEGVIGARLN